jgi:uncharacterized protein YabE (DUF348 family)
VKWLALHCIILGCLQVDAGCRSFGEMEMAVTVTVTVLGVDRNIFSVAVTVIDTVKGIGISNSTVLLLPVAVSVTSQL